MLRRPIAGVLLLCFLAACTSWHVEKEVGPLQLISTKHPRVVQRATKWPKPFECWLNTPAQKPAHQRIEP